MITKNRLYYINHQNGIALIAALMVLLILTLIGVTTMNTTTLEERMAINMQENFSAFHLAESGINQALNDRTTITAGTPLTGAPISLTPVTIGSHQTNVTVTYKEITKVPAAVAREAIYSAVQGSVNAVHFQITSLGTSGAYAKSTINAGMFIVAPGSGGSN